MKKIFLTFADQRMHRALGRIHHQAVSMGVYDGIVIANENNLDLNFREKFAKYLKPEFRGFGYWSWKAQIILQTLDQMSEGDLLQYTDAGCHLNPNGRKKLEEYFSKAQKSESGILAFQAIPPSFHNGKIKLPDLRESKWCKGDLCDALAVRSSSTVMDTQAIGAGVIFIKKCDESINVVRKWLAVYQNNISLIDNSKSKSEDPPGFVEHRHDQSIFSILAKLNRVETISAYEYWYPHARYPFIPDWRILKDYPVHAKRDKGVYWALKPYALLLRVLKRIRFELKKRRSFD
jgi:hypothetical protein